MALPRIFAATRPRVFKFRQMEFFAARGLVHKLDRHTGEYRPISIGEFVKQAWTWSAAAKRKGYSDERLEHMRLVEAMITCARQAKAQGDPHSPDAVRSMMVRRPMSIQVPGQVSRPAGEAPQLVIPGRDYPNVKPESNGYAPGQTHVLTPRVLSGR